MCSPTGYEYSLYGGSALLTWFTFSLIYAMIILEGAGVIRGGPVITDTGTLSPNGLLQHQTKFFMQSPYGGWIKITGLGQGVDACPM
jgi:hypothetical protein